MAEVPGSSASPPPHLDAPWINSPVLFTTGPLRGKWIRAELVVQQQPRRGRKGAIHDLRPLHPPPTLRLRLYEVQYPIPRWTVIPGSVPERIQYIDPPIVPPPDAPRVPISMTAALTTHFLCFASLFKVHPPTREQEYGRVDRKITVGSSEAPTTSATSPLSPYSPQAPPGDIIERPKSDRSRAWKFIRPHPMTAISCRDPQWPLAVSEAWNKFHQDGAPAANPLANVESGPEDVKGIETIEGDLSFAEMAILEPYLPREPPKWMNPPCDVTAHLSKRETAGHLIPSIENKEPSLYFVFSDLAIRNEGYFSLRFHVINLNWHVHPQFTRSGPGFFSPLATCVTNTFAVYSTKEFPGLPPVTEFTSHLVQHGVRIRFRDDRALDTTMREGRNRGEGKARSTRKQSSKQSPEISNEDTEDGTSVVNTTTAQTEVPMKRENDQWDEETIQRAMNVWRKSPSGTAYHQQFNNDALNQNVEARAQRLTIQTQRLLERSGEGASHVSPVTSPDAEHNLARTRSNPIIHHPNVSPVNTEAHYPYGANRYKPSTSTQQAATPRRSLSFAATSMFRTGDENWIGSQQSAYPYPEDDSVYPPRTLEWNENSDYQSRAPVPSASASQDGMTAASRGMPHHRYHPYPMPTSASYTHEYTQQGPSSVLQSNYSVPENDGGSQFESKYPNVHPFNTGF